MRHSFVMATLLAFPLAAAAQGTDPNAGRNLSASCASCHNVTGKAEPGMPALAGQSKDSLLKALKEFKEGKRPAATVMHQIAKGYTDAQLELMAAYFAAQK